MSKQDETYGTVAKVLASILKESTNPTSMNWDVFIKITDHFTNVSDAMYEYGYTKGSEFADEKHEDSEILEYDRGRVQGYEEGYNVGKASAESVNNAGYNNKDLDEAYAFGWNAAKREAERLKNGLA